MTTEEIIAMAKEAGARSEHWATRLFPAAQFLFTPDELSRFAALVAAKEREACANVCDERSQDVKLSNLRRCDADLLARAIRARSQA